MSDIAASVAGFITDSAADRTELQSKARIMLADALVLAIAASEVEGMEKLARSLASGSGSSLVWMTGSRVGSADAALINGICTHARFQDDTDMTSWSHPGSFVVPAAVAAAEYAGASFGTLLEGLVVGYAVSVWSGAEEEVAKDVIGRGFRGSPTFGPMASCAAACRVLGLTREQSAHAIRIAAPLGRGTLHTVGAGGEDWRLHNGSASRDGLTAALVTEAGMQGGVGALEGPKGFLEAFAGRSDVPEQWRVLPEVEGILSVWHKALPTLGDNMAAALVACVAHERLHDRGVKRVEVRINDSFSRYPGVDRDPPYETFVQALASVKFAVARCLLTGTVRLSDYSTMREDPVTVRIAGDTGLTGDGSLSYTEAEITVHTDSGPLTVTTSELERTLFYRDENEARRSAERLLGSRGRRLVGGLLSAKTDEPASEVIARSLLLGRS